MDWYRVCCGFLVKIRLNPEQLTLILIYDGYADYIHSVNSTFYTNFILSSVWTSTMMHHITFYCYMINLVKSTQSNASQLEHRSADHSLHTKKSLLERFICRSAYTDTHTHNPIQLS